MEPLITDHPELEHDLRGIEGHVFIDHLEGSDYQVSFHSDPWGAPSQFVAWIYVATDPDRIVVETGTFNGLDEDQQPVRNERLHEKAKELFRRLVMRNADEKTSEVIQALVRRAADHPGEMFQFVLAFAEFRMDEADDLFGEGFAEYIKEVGHRL